MRKLFYLVLLSSFSACTPVYISNPAQELTTGIVQREIHMGMPASDVASILGSPNIVSLDENRDEVWVYDKVSSEVQYSSHGGGVWLVIAGCGSNSGYSRRSQNTLTIVVKFDQDKLVKDFTYHSSRF